MYRCILQPLQIGPCMLVLILSTPEGKDPNFKNIPIVFKFQHTLRLLFFATAIYLAIFSEEELVTTNYFSI